LPILHPDPPRIPTHLGSARAVLASLRGLPPEAHLFVRLGIPDGDGPGERDLDFLVLHPELGLVIVQAEADQPGPEADAEAAAALGAALGAGLTRTQYRLLNFLKQAGLPAPPITRVQALPALPLKPGQALGPELPAWRILTRDKLRQPFPALREAVSGGRPWASWRALDRAAHGDLAPEPFQALVALLASRLLPQPAPAELAAEGGARDPGTGRLLDHLAHNFSQGRYRVQGAPGSGKSLLGRKVARLWAAEGRSVLLLASERSRADAAGAALEELVRNGQAVASTYPDLGRELLEDRRTPGQDLAGAEQAATLGRAVAACRTRWDALVLDDAQELGPEWAGPLLGLLRDPQRDPVLVLEDPAGGASAMPGQPWRLDLE